MPTTWNENDHAQLHPSTLEIEQGFFRVKLAVMEFHYDALLPEEYIRENSLRLEVYHRLGDTTTLQS